MPSTNLLSFQDALRSHMPPNYWYNQPHTLLRRLRATSRCLRDTIETILLASDPLLRHPAAGISATLLHHAIYGRMGRDVPVLLRIRSIPYTDPRPHPDPRELPLEPCWFHPGAYNPKKVSHLARLWLANGVCPGWVQLLRVQGVRQEFRCREPPKLLRQLQVSCYSLPVSLDSSGLCLSDSCRLCLSESSAAMLQSIGCSLMRAPRADSSWSGTRTRQACVLR